MVKAVGKKIQKNYKRVRDTSLWKFMHSRRQSVNGKFRLCPDTGSACYMRKQRRKCLVYIGVSFLE